jgi:GNAT superfamily N-acetyltransferase
MSNEVAVREVREAELDEADRIFRLAFGTQSKLANPTGAFGDRNMIKSRWSGRTSTVVIAESEGRLVGTNVITRWGSVGFFGRMAVHPEMWGKGIASKLLDSTIRLFEDWRTSQNGLDTFPDSEKHIHLYQKHGFWPRYLTAMMSKKLGRDKLRLKTGQYSVSFSSLNEDARKRCLERAKGLADSIYRGLDLSNEIQSVYSQSLGDTVLLYEEGDRPELVGFAICHTGANTEAGSGNCYVKFGAAKSEDIFKRLIAASEYYASTKGLSRISGAVNTARHEAYKIMLDYGFEIATTRVCMHNPNEASYNKPGVYVIDRWS